MRSYEEIKKAVIAKGYIWFEGELNPNLIFERTSDKYTNAFTDWMYICYQEKGKNKIKSCRATTKPGLYGEGTILNPKMIEGIVGTAVVVPNQYKGLWHMSFFNRLEEGISCMSGNPHLCPSLRQIGDVTVWRDGNKDLMIDKDAPKTTGGHYGINCHYMGNDQTPKIYSDDNLNNWSLGCFGAPLEDIYYLFLVLKYCSAKTGNIISMTLLETKDFQTK